VGALAGLEKLKQLDLRGCTSLTEIPAALRERFPKLMP